MSQNGMSQVDTILLTVDSLRYDAIFNDDGIIRNELSGFKRLADSGVSFDNAWATAPYTRTSVPSIISGSYSWSYDGDVYESDRPHIAEAFKQIGYATAGLHSNPFLDKRYGWNRGFDYYFNGSSNGDQDQIRKRIVSIASRFNVTQRWGRKALSFIGRYTGKDLRTGNGEPYVTADTIQERATDWLQKQSRPVFMWIHYMDVHNPWYPQDGTVSDKFDEADLLKIFYKARDNPTSITRSEKEKLRVAYEGSVQNFDDHLYKLLNRLEEILNNPVVCLTSDHGELFGEYNEFFHSGLLKPELLHVPLLFSGGGEINKNNIDDQIPVSTVDIMPTLSNIAGGKSDVRLDGIDLFNNSYVNREIFSSARNHVRIVSNNHNDIYEVSEIPEIGYLSASGQEQLSQLYSSEVHESISQFDDEDLEDQLEALGYK
jgi:arylsulfatase A-like enzyme